jgi:hypothetical protein
MSDNILKKKIMMLQEYIELQKEILEINAFNNQNEKK